MGFTINPSSELIAAPELLIPGKKPVGPVKLTSESYSYKPLFYYVLQGNVKDISENGLDGSLVNSPIFIGESLELLKSSDDHITFTGLAGFGGTGQKSTLILTLRLDNADVNGAMILGTTNAGSIYTQFHTTGSSIIYVQNAAVSTSGINFTDSKERTIIIIHDGATTSIITEGSVIGTRAGSVSSYSTAEKTFNIFKWPPSGAYGADVGVKQVAWFGDAMPLALALKISKDPYSLVQAA